ncbi:protein FAM217B-like isoform X1 [Sinocyclocheilus anshuiensis]|uniref:Protein FAM217B-like n=2 Tax=Sinocyclocheilus anshuiensis TaxID=1608454 RepID=A0A671K0R6_9TELE|nr:PREDICTED: protein FAM217B-like isoform X1 [Sinocyclocheilus anshuiensis]
MPEMGTVLQERTVHYSQNKLRSFDRTQTNPVGHAPSKKTTKAPLHPPPNNGISLSSEPDSQQRLRRTRLDKMLIMANPTDRQHNAKIKSHATSKNGQKERQQRQNSHGAKESGGRGKSSSVRPVYPHPVQAQREDSSECRPKDESCTLQSKDGEEDSASDLSDSERYSALPAQISPPDLNLRAEVIDPSDFHASRPSCRRHNKFRGSYPDFLPPPFNSWSLLQLAVYLNTEGKGIPRPKPTGQLERYLDRLLQLEWHQIQTVQEDSSKTNAPLPKGRNLPHSTSHRSLSSPKCILQCQRAFPLALLSSFASAPTLQLSSCTCPHCQNQYPILNGTCRSFAYHHHTRLSPLLEKKGQVSGLPKRSSSESRAHQLEPRHRSREHRLSDPLSESSHLRRMQAIGNIRNPVGSTYSVDQVSSTATTASNASIGDVKKRRPGQRSHSCVGMREVGYRARGRSEQRKTFDKTQQDPKLACAVSSDGLHSSKDSVTSRLTQRQKHVEFVTK